MSVLSRLFFLFLWACQPAQKWDYPFPFIGLAIDGFPLSEERIALHVAESRISPAVIVFYVQWPFSADGQKPLRPTLDAIWNNKSVPCMTWEPMIIVNSIETTIDYEDILNGKYDEYLNWMASEIKLWEKPIIIRLAQEMNLFRYHWGKPLKDYNASSLKIYQSLFRYVVTFFRNKQVKNVLWAFCANAESVPNENWNAVKDYYPGDQYVDILGMDGYNWDIDAKLAAKRGQTWTKPWRSFKEIFTPLYHELKLIAPEKPLIVFETASVDRSQSKQKELWIQEALKVSKKWNIQGFIWFQVDKEEDWKLRQEKNRLIDPEQPSFQDWLLKNFNDFR